MFLFKDARSVKDVFIRKMRLMKLLHTQTVEHRQIPTRRSLLPVQKLDATNTTLSAVMSAMAQPTKTSVIGLGSFGTVKELLLKQFRFVSSLILVKKPASNLSVSQEIMLMKMLRRMSLLQQLTTKVLPKFSKPIQIKLQRQMKLKLISNKPLRS